MPSLLSTARSRVPRSGLRTRTDRRARSGRSTITFEMLSSVDHRRWRNSRHDGHVIKPRDLDVAEEVDIGDVCLIVLLVAVVIVPQRHRYTALYHIIEGSVSRAGSWRGTKRESEQSGVRTAPRTPCPDIDPRGATCGGVVERTNERTENQMKLYGCIARRIIHADTAAAAAAAGTRDPLYRERQ